MASTFISFRSWIVVVILFAGAACDDAATPRASDSEPDSDSVGVQDSIDHAVAAMADCGVSSETDLTGDGIGDLRIDRSVNEIMDRCHVLRDTVEVRAEGHPQRVMTIDLMRDEVEAEIVDEVVWRLGISTPAFLTSDSLGVGTPLERLLEFDGARPLVGEGNLFVQVPEHCGLSFRLTEPASSLPPGETDRAGLQELPSGTQVDHVLAVGCTER